MTPLEVLGLPRTATQSEIRTKYKALAQIYHPDRYADASDAVRKEAATRMLALNAAYEALTGGSDRRPATMSPSGPRFPFASPQWFDAVEQICAIAPPCTPAGEPRFVNHIIRPAIPGVLTTFHWGFDEDGQFRIGSGHVEQPWLTQRDSYAGSSQFLEFTRHASSLNERAINAVEGARLSAAELWRNATGQRRSRGSWWRWNQAWGHADKDVVNGLRIAIAEITAG